MQNSSSSLHAATVPNLLQRQQQQTPTKTGSDLRFLASFVSRRSERRVDRPLLEKMEANEWANPTAIATFTWPLLGIGRPASLGENSAVLRTVLQVFLAPPAMFVSYDLLRFERSKREEEEGEEDQRSRGSVVYLLYRGLYAATSFQMPLLFPIITASYFASVFGGQF